MFFCQIWSCRTVVCEIQFQKNDFFPISLQNHAVANYLAQILSLKLLLISQRFRKLSPVTTAALCCYSRMRDSYGTQTC